MSEGVDGLFGYRLIGEAGQMDSRMFAEKTQNMKRPNPVPFVRRKRDAMNQVEDVGPVVHGVRVFQAGCK
jgi:hypothetical protein